ncbi:hypothetical protein Bca4012_037138 [Brassica carinata]
MLAQFHLKVAFGDSSDDEHLADRETSVVGDSTKAVWERVGKINGLWFCRNFLSVHHQSDLLSAILDKGWFVQESINQFLLSDLNIWSQIAMRFGDLPSWATELSDLILESVESVYLPVLPADLLWREPLCSTSSFSIYTNQVRILPLLLMRHTKMKFLLTWYIPLFFTILSNDGLYGSRTELKKMKLSVESISLNLQKIWMFPEIQRNQSKSCLHSRHEYRKQSVQIRSNMKSNHEVYAILKGLNPWTWW